MQERKKLVAPCGIDCGICELYMSRDNQQLMDYLLVKGIPKEKLPCDGCRSINGNCPVIPCQCDTFKCAETNKVDFCFECDEFPCSKLAPAVDRADTLPHNIKLFNLCMIKKSGLEDFIKKSLEIKQTYYKGKMEVGKGPNLDKS